MYYSEFSRYRIEPSRQEPRTATHLESGEKVKIGNGYLESFLLSAEDYEKTIQVGREDKLWTPKQVQDELSKLKFGINVGIQEIAKAAREVPRVGDVRVRGIRSIFKSIPLGEVFTVTFQKKGVKLTDRQFKKKQEEYLAEARERLEKKQRWKEGILDAALEEIQHLMDNPINQVEAGADRTLIGYKMENNPKGSHYMCMDLEIMENRLVNISTINRLVSRGVKYTL